MWIIGRMNISFDISMCAKKRVMACIISLHFHSMFIHRSLINETETIQMSTRNRSSSEV